MKTLVWITFPSVDIVNPEEDEIIERLARLLHEHGLKGEFIFSGIKLQSTLANRPTTIDYLDKVRMTIGYQGNAHSLHPGLMEYAEGCGWDDGVTEATRRETKWIHMDGEMDSTKPGGILLLRDTFGDQFVSFRGAGGWTPQVMEVLRQNDITVHHTLFDLAEATGQTMCAYIGCLQISPGRSRWTGKFPYASPLTNRLELEQIVRFPDQSISKFEENFELVIQNYPFRGARILFINFHPFFLFTDTVSDILNYSNGRMPEPPSNIVRSNLLPKVEMERRWVVLKQIIDWIIKRSDVRVVTSLDFLDQSRSLSLTVRGEEIESIAQDIACLTITRPPAYVRYAEKILSLSEAFGLLQDALIYFNQYGQLPNELRTNFRPGPSDLPSKATDRVTVYSVAEIIVSAQSLEKDQIPSQIPFPDGPVAPYPYMVGMARALLWRQEPSRKILIRPTDFIYPELAESFSLYLRRCADWEIYNRNLDPTNLEKHASLQLWTYKPIEWMK